MDILLTGIFIRVRLLNVPSVTSSSITIEMSFLLQIEITEDFNLHSFEHCK